MLESVSVSCLSILPTLPLSKKKIHILYVFFVLSAKLYFNSSTNRSLNSTGESLSLKFFSIDFCFWPQWSVRDQIHPYLKQLKKSAQIYETMVSKPRQQAVQTVNLREWTQREPGELPGHHPNGASNPEDRRVQRSAV